MWEYQVITLKGFDATQEAIERRLNKEGEVGWECFSVSSMVIPGTAMQIVLFMKRAYEGQLIRMEVSS